MDTRDAADRWARTWTSAWPAHDPDAVAALYAEDCVHHSMPFRTPHRGRDGMRAYLVDAFAQESTVVEVRFSRPLVEGVRAWVEYWVLAHDRDGAPVTLAGTALAWFGGDGLITDSRDYWHETPGHLPQPRWAA